VCGGRGEGYAGRSARQVLGAWCLKVGPQDTQDVPLEDGEEEDPEVDPDTTQ